MHCSKAIIKKRKEQQNNGNDVILSNTFFFTKTIASLALTTLIKLIKYTILIMQTGKE